MSRSRAANLLTDAYAVVIRPVLTEKSHDMLSLGEEHQARYTFEVHPKATKEQIKKAIEEAFEVKVASVNTMMVKPRRKSFRMVSGRGGVGFTRARKKAVVRLTRDSKTIDLI
jgi:large subunit ribosomal protein L23